MKTLNIKVEEFEQFNHWIASIEDPDYKGMVVQGNSLIDVLKELTKSLEVLQAYNQKMQDGFQRKRTK